MSLYSSSIDYIEKFDPNDPTCFVHICLFTINNAGCLAPSPSSDEAPGLVPAGLADVAEVVAAAARVPEVLLALHLPGQAVLLV